MSIFTKQSNDLLTRDQLAAALTEHGFRISSSTLAQLRTTGRGPDFELVKQERGNARALYRWGAALAWAKARGDRRRRVA